MPTRLQFAAPFRNVPGHICSPLIGSLFRQSFASHVRHYALGSAKAAASVAMLNRPIGVETAPLATDNTGIDTRTRAQKKADFTNYEKHLARRKELTAEMARSQFQDIYNFRDTLGKTWIAPRSYFRSDKALYMPNFFGRTLLSKSKQGTTSVLAGHLSIVRVFTALTGEKQANSYFVPADVANPTDTDFQNAANSVREDGFQVVDINIPENWPKEFLVNLFVDRIKALFADPARAGRYFIARKGVTKEVTGPILAENKYAGYIYLVDRNCKIRWAACGTATKEERDSLWRAVAALKKEHTQ